MVLSHQLIAHRMQRKARASEQLEFWRPLSVALCSSCSSLNIHNQFSPPCLSDILSRTSLPLQPIIFRIFPRSRSISVAYFNSTASSDEEIQRCRIIEEELLQVRNVRFVGVFWRKKTFLSKSIPRKIAFIFCSRCQIPMKISPKCSRNSVSVTQRVPLHGHHGGVRQNQ